MPAALKACGSLQCTCLSLFQVTRELCMHRAHTNTNTIADTTLSNATQPVLVQCRRCEAVQGLPLRLLRYQLGFPQLLPQLLDLLLKRHLVGWTVGCIGAQHVSEGHVPQSVFVCEFWGGGVRVVAMPSYMLTGHIVSQALSTALDSLGALLCRYRQVLGNVLTVNALLHCRSCVVLPVTLYSNLTAAAAAGLHG